VEVDSILARLEKVATTIRTLDDLGLIITL